MMSWREQFYAGAMLLLKCSLGIWAGFWGWRRWQDLDQPLDRSMKALRWSVVLIGWLVAAAVPAGRFWPIRAVFGVLALAFFVWPNFAFHAMKRFRRRDFHHVEGILRRWNPAGIPDNDMNALEFYDAYAPRLIASLQRGSGVVTVGNELGEIRNEVGLAPAPMTDLPVAQELLDWWHSRRKSEATA